MENTISKQVYATKNYSMFSHIQGNRDVNMLHVKRLKKSLEKNNLFSVVIVNENYEIIDGQHRFEVLKQLNADINYVICYGYGLREVQILNANTANWKMSDYLDGYCDLGYSDYILFKKFIKHFDLKFNPALILLNGTDMESQRNAFYNGDYRISNYNKSLEYANHVENIYKYFKGAKRRSFILALVKLLNNKDFEIATFMRKLELQPNSLTPMTNTQQYLEAIENIYNYRNQKKISFKYIK